MNVLSLLGLTILGNNSALPAFDRHPTAQALYFDDQIFLIDCGEGTQMQLTRYKVKRSRINHIFISHLHGDHYFGLIGLINSMGLMGRNAPLHIYCPAALPPILQAQFDAASTTLSFDLEFHINRVDGLIFANEKIEVSSFSVKHRIECWGYQFRELKIPRRLEKEKLVAYDIPTIFYRRLQMGEDYLREDGSVVKNEWVTHANEPAKIYAYCADTIFDPELAEKIKGVNLLYHEATYLHDKLERAQLRFHSTAMQAGEIARLAGVGQLLIGHFSSQYDSLQPFLEEVKEVFPNAELALEGVTFRIA